MKDRGQDKQEETCNLEEAGIVERHFALFTFIVQDKLKEKQHICKCLFFSRTDSLEDLRTKGRFPLN
jgi:hypothetical protein